MIRLKNVKISNLTGNPIPIPYKARITAKAGEDESQIIRAYYQTGFPSLFLLEEGHLCTLIQLAKKIVNSIKNNKLMSKDVVIITFHPEIASIIYEHAKKENIPIHFYTLIEGEFIEYDNPEGIINIMKEGCDDVEMV